MPIFKLVVRSSTGWPRHDLDRVSRRAGALRHPPAEVTDRGLELMMNAPSREAARVKLETAVHGIHSHTGVYLDEEVRF
jgi:hypothetical protein